MIKRFYLLLILLTIFIINSCERDINSVSIIEPNDLFEKENYNYSDSLVLYFAYNGNKIPEDFFKEELENKRLNYIGEFQFQDDMYLWYEPSVSNKNEARILINQRLRELRIDSTKIQDGNHNNKYFEFIYPGYLNPSQKDFLFRVHNLEYFDGVYFSAVDSNSNQVIRIGKFNLESKSENSIKELFDRLWYYKNWNYTDGKVLDRYIIQKSKYFLYVIYYTTIIRGDYGIRDEINLFKSEYLFDIDSGETLIKNKILNRIAGNYN